MLDFIEFFKEIDINNIIFLIALSIGIIVIFAGCVRPFFASSIEILFMNKEDQLKQLSLTYIIMFLAFGIVNYFFISDVSFIVVCFIAMILMLIIYGIFFIANKLGKFQKVFSWYKERFGITFIIIFVPEIAYACSATTGIKIAGCAVLGALAEIIVMVIIYINPTPRASAIFIEIDNVKWYMFRRLDDDHFLCGDQNSVIKCTKIKVLDLDTMVQGNISIETEDVESE